MSSDVIRVAPERIRYKLEDVSDLEAPVWPGNWDRDRRMPLEQADKHRAMVQRYHDGWRWEATDLFRNVYRVRFERGEHVRGCGSIEELAAQYYDRVDGLFAHLKAHGFLGRIDGTPVKLPDVYLARDGEVILSNDGNHRVAMAKVLKLPYVLANVRTRHPAMTTPLETVTLEPVLHPGAADIPAMTSPAEQFTYYELAKAGRGLVVELGTWLGASTVYLAAGVRDAGAGHVHTYDRFDWKPIHEVKAGGPLPRPMLEQVRHHLGPLGVHVEIHVGEFLTAEWDGTPIAVLVADGPKRVREIARVLTVFGPSLRPGSIMAWQDFAYFPAYDLPACFDQLERAGAVRFVKGVYPGTTAVFHVERPITAADVRFRLADAAIEGIEGTWFRWAERLPAGARPRFLCGAALFLCDQGQGERGASLFRWLLAKHRDEIAPKWGYLRDVRPAFVAKYPALYAELDRG